VGGQRRGDATSLQPNRGAAGTLATHWLHDRIPPFHWRAIVHLGAMSSPSWRAIALLNAPCEWLI